VDLTNFSITFSLVKSAFANVQVSLQGFSCGILISPTRGNQLTWKYPKARDCDGSVSNVVNFAALWAKDYSCVNNGYRNPRKEKTPADPSDIIVFEGERAFTADGSKWYRAKLCAKTHIFHIVREAHVLTKNGEWQEFE